MWEGFPLTVKAFEDNKAESAAAPAVVRHSQQRIDVNGVAVGANAGVFHKTIRMGKSERMPTVLVTGLMGAAFSDVLPTSAGSGAANISV